ncbi:uncharacterized protein N7496_008734 [Penicillium cataractarum]|uniref:Glycosyl transferase family 1 domain-containing protein n=1 Tax=Penicillium cataractarum TaxID=2100454 RepID=A0A9W9S1M7_9EURO|nr:uncharacterized protein N7496_008734 [Penicillium cataractarum]KAJ5368974.1 hypothetical protein N7496_008734 [Penicillium cataractarum]
MDELRNYIETHSEKILGVAFARTLHSHVPGLCSQLWAELDILPILLEEESDIDASPENVTRVHFDRKPLDEQAESLSRKCIRYTFDLMHKLDILLWMFGVAHETDHKSTDSLDRPNCLLYMLDSMVELKWILHSIFDWQIGAHFGEPATPQGGGVALMRHALLRLAHELEVDFKWYVPKPRPGVFRITKTNHNILQGVSDSSERLSSDSQQQLIDWIEDNAERYWTQRGGPLCRTSDGGADIVIVDDSQMPRLVSIAKEIDRQRPVIFRSHIQLRSDLIAVPGSPQEEVWNFLWEHLREADVFISHPVARLDGLNKEMREYDTAFYGCQFNQLCRDAEMTVVQYPDDDPDGFIIYDAALRYIANSMPYLSTMISIMRLGPSDQILNTLLSKAHIVLQLSSQEGFEVKVSEALHKGKPVIATRAGGIPLQIDHGTTGYLVDVGDTDSVAQYMLDLWTDDDLYDRMSANSSRHTCDEISTVGNALNWLFLSCKLSRGERLQLNQRWIQDLARMDVGREYNAAEKRLKRSIA